MNLGFKLKQVQQTGQLSKKDKLKMIFLASIIDIKVIKPSNIQTQFITRDTNKRTKGCL